MLSANFSKRILTLSVISHFIFSTSAYAAPTGGTVVAGNATVSSAGNQTVINQTSQHTVINWSKFDTAAHESVKFQQPNTSAIALNRVTSGLPTHYSGLLSANGQVWVINPAGVLFSKTSRIDVAGLMATTHEIDTKDFMKGKYQFKFVKGAENSTIVNEGHVSAKNAGLVALVAPGVENRGIIEAYLGRVALSSGTAFVLDLYGDKLIHFGSSAKAQNGYVKNSGLIKADGGKVLMTAHSAGRVLDDVISMSGVIEAKMVSAGQRGEIILHSLESSGKVKVTGTLDASNGGFIETSGHEVDVNQAKINAGEGGTWLLDPLNITIVSGSGLNTTPGTSTIGTNLIIAQLNAGTNVILDTNVPGTGAGNIKITAPITHSQASGLSPTLTLNAVGTVTFSGVSPILSTGAIPLNVVMNGSSIAVSQPINVGAGSVALNALATTVTQTAAGIITASSLTTTSKTGTGLSTATNAVSNFNATNLTSGSISLKNNGPLNITGINQTGGNLAITNSTGPISQTGQISVSGTSNFNAGSNAINLLGNNNFTGAVALNSSSNVSINNNIDLSLAASTIGGNLIVTTNNSAITQTGVLAVGGTSNFNSGSGAINLNTSNNVFAGPVTLLTSSNASIKNNIALSLASSTIGGNLVVSTTNDAITQTGALNVSGTSSFSAGSNSIDLSHAGNHFTNAVMLSNSGAFDVSLNNSTNMILGTTKIGRNLTVTTNNGSITQSGVITVAGLSSFNSGTNYIDLSTSANAFAKAISFTSGSHVAVKNNRGLVLGSSTVGGNLTASTTNDAITQTGALSVQGSSNFNAGANKIDLLTNGSGNQFFGAVSLFNQGNFDVSIQNAVNLVLGNSAIGRNFKVVSNNNAITQIDGLSVGGTSNFNAGSNTINLSGSNNLTGAVALNNSGTNHAVTLHNNSSTVLNTSTVSGVLKVISGGNLTLNGVLKSNASSEQRSIILSATNLINNKNASVLSPGLNNTFALYLSDPSTSVFKGLASGNQAIWNNTLSTLSPENLPVGNRYIFSTQPILTVTTLDISKIYGTDLTNAMGSHFTVSGFVNAASYGNVFTQDTVANTLTNTAVTSVGALPTASVLGGPYAVESNATATTGYGVVLQNSGNITVTPASLSITSSGQAKTYGQTLSGTTSSFTSSGLKNNETIGTVDIVSNGLAPTATVIGGPYAITEVSNASGGTFDKNNYVIAYNPFATITVNRAPLVITANNQTKILGQNFSFAGTEFVSTGLVNSDTVSSVRLNTVGGSSPYLISPSDAIGTGLSNYNIQYVDGLLVVNSASTVPVVDYKKKIGSKFMSPDTHVTLIVVGEVLRVSGEVMAVNGKGVAQSLSVGRKIYLGSKLIAEKKDSSADVRTFSGDIIHIDYGSPYSF